MKPKRFIISVGLSRAAKKNQVFWEQERHVFFSLAFCVRVIFIDSHLFFSGELNRCLENWKEQTSFFPWKFIDFIESEGRKKFYMSVKHTLTLP